MFVIATLVICTGVAIISIAVIGIVASWRRQKDIQKHKSFLDRYNGWMI